MAIDVKAILGELRRELAALYGERLRGLYLFGSYARGEADAESDLDVAVVLDRVERYGEEVDRVGGLVSRLSLEHDVSILPVFVSEEAWRTDDSLLLVNARQDAIPA